MTALNTMFLHDPPVALVMAGVGMPSWRYAAEAGLTGCDVGGMDVDGLRSIASDIDTAHNTSALMHA